MFVGTYRPSRQICLAPTRMESFCVTSTGCEHPIILLSSPEQQGFGNLYLVSSSAPSCRSPYTWRRPVPSPFHYLCGGRWAVGTKCPQGGPGEAGYEEPFNSSPVLFSGAPKPARHPEACVRLPHLFPSPLYLTSP